MSKYVDAEKLITELRKHLIPTVVDRDYDEWEQGKDAGLLQAIDIVESLQQEQPDEQPEYGYQSIEYINGKKSRWNVGDVLAYYISTSNEEGEYIIGKVSNVEFDNEEGWLYTFENEDVYDEQYLVEEGAYKKN